MKTPRQYEEEARQLKYQAIHQTFCHTFAHISTDWHAKYGS